MSTRLTRNIFAPCRANSSPSSGPHLKPLPAWIPEVYRLHQRMVDVEGYVSLHSNRYSVPASLIGRRVEVRETRDKIEIELDARHMVTHQRLATADQRARDACPNTGPRGARVPVSVPCTRKNKPSSPPRRNWRLTWRR